MSDVSRPRPGRRTFDDLGLLLLRVVAGGLMVVLHGYPKVERLLAGGTFADPLGLGPQVSLMLAMFAELICAGFVVVGFMTRFACVPLMVTMFVAAFVVHGADPLPKKELALLYGFVFSALFMTGPGKYAVDGQR